MPCFLGATEKSLAGQVRLAEESLALAIQVRIAEATDMLSSLFGFERCALVPRGPVLGALLALIFEANSTVSYGLKRILKTTRPFAGHLPEALHDLVRLLKCHPVFDDTPEWHWRRAVSHHISFRLCGLFRQKVVSSLPCLVLRSFSELAHNKSTSIYSYHIGEIKLSTRRSDEAAMRLVFFNALEKIVAKDTVDRRD